MSSRSLADLKNVSAADKKMIQDIEKMMGPEPSEMGFVKNSFWGRFREDLMLPYPVVSQSEEERCDALLSELKDYMENEHPRIQIDQEEEIPEWCIERLFEIGVLGMTVPEEFGGLGLGVTSYNRVLEMIGSYCGSTAVVVSARQSIGCKAIMLFGNEKQKEEYLPIVARQSLSGFCLSEPQVGSDAAGQETNCVLTEDGKHFILNGEKKWTTSGAYSALFTVMANQQVVDAKTGRTKRGVTALIVTPDMEGVEIFQNNRSKTGIRGTWQARIRFTDVKVPRENVLHKEGKGLNVALTCLNYGRCTLAAGILGAAKRAADQTTKWAQTRYQFDRPIADFEAIQAKLAYMSALNYGMDAVLYMVTGMLDRHDKDIMVETAINKVFCSHYGWEVIDTAMQVMGGEGYMTENELERIWRDNRIHRIVEGANEVMQSFIFAYGGKQLAEQMLVVKEALDWDRDADVEANLTRILPNALNFDLLKRAVPLALQLFFGVKPSKPEIYGLHPALFDFGDRLMSMVQDHSHFFKMLSKWEEEEIVGRQVQQARAADNAVMLFALSCSLSRMDHQLRSGDHGLRFQRDQAAFEHLFDLFELKFYQNVGEMRDNADDSMRRAAAAARRYNDTLPNEEFYIPESSPVAQGEGMETQQAHIKQFPGGHRTLQGDGATGQLPNVERTASA
jgi:alkylation response protein AidB-like acyl-CoA dehydrogenase